MTLNYIKTLDTYYFYIIQKKKSGKKKFFQKKIFFRNPNFRNFRYHSIFKAKFGAVIVSWLTKRCNKPIATNVYFPTSGQTLQTKNFTIKNFFPPWLVLFWFFQIFTIFPNLDYSGLKTPSRTSTFSALFSKNRGKNLWNRF